MVKANGTVKLNAHRYKEQPKFMNGKCKIRIEKIYDVRCVRKILQKSYQKEK